MLATTSSSSAAKISRNARRRNFDSDLSVTTGHRKTAIIAISGNEPQAPRNAASVSPPQPDKLTNAHAALYVMHSAIASRDQRARNVLRENAIRGNIGTRDCRFSTNRQSATLASLSVSRQTAGGQEGLKRIPDRDASPTNTAADGPGRLCRRAGGHRESGHRQHRRHLGLRVPRALADARQACRPG